VQVARPYVRNLRPAAVDLAKASPDLVSSFHELNRFFDMAAYNPNGREPVVNTGNPVADEAANKKRDEGYLYWLAWVAQNTTSLFSTSDAQGPLRRFTVFFSCTDLRSQVASNPAGGPLLGLTNALNDPGLCPSGEGATGGGSGLPIPGVPKQQAKPTKQTSQPKPATSATPTGAVNAAPRKR
jgi:phospholipid/cholesterol/gamma-HCH transport system substrate-binding protein